VWISAHWLNPAAFVLEVTADQTLFLVPAFLRHRHLPYMTAMRLLPADDAGVSPDWICNYYNSQARRSVRSSRRLRLGCQHPQCGGGVEALLHVILVVRTRDTR
jgi:hypothetical protein